MTQAEVFVAAARAAAETQAKAEVAAAAAKTAADAAAAAQATVKAGVTSSSEPQVNTVLMQDGSAILHRPGDGAQSDRVAVLPTDWATGSFGLAFLTMGELRRS
ncbi:hypothetical protein [Sphingomonas azotifigens]|uniref:hypothetical protein n=1 Tax=Sphingomonas azotifigens TaxID=330920 RepID=UPI0009FBE6AD|nr:hypothetical protein [Sphingomonas azotifigens]